LRRGFSPSPSGGLACLSLCLAVLSGGCGSSGPSAPAMGEPAPKSRFEKLQRVGEAHKKHLQEKARAGFIKRR
jgi:hypothetical protein